MEYGGDRQALDNSGILINLLLEILALCDQIRVATDTRKFSGHYTPFPLIDINIIFTFS
jgi:hypothetical protein